MLSKLWDDIRWWWYGRIPKNFFARLWCKFRHKKIYWHRAEELDGDEVIVTHKHKRFADGSFIRCYYGWHCKKCDFDFLTYYQKIEGNLPERDRELGL